MKWVKAMKLIVCLDDKNGMLFNKRRQSSDIEVCKRVLALTGESVLWMNAYSGKLFEGLGANVCVDESFWERAGQQDWCFVENVDVQTFVPRADEIVIYRWNRVYPADLRFPIHLLDGWTKTQTLDFPGNSHEMITQEVYRP